MILGVIPARWASSRFPGKPLAEIAGKPMLWHVYQRCVEAACLDRIVVATDDERISDACTHYSLDWTMTQAYHPTGTDRVAEVATHIPAEYYINVQGDEPLVAPSAISAIVEARRSGRLPTNGCAEITDLADLIDITVPKVVVAPDWTAIYLSRWAIPYPKSRTTPHYSQVCVYGFDRGDLEWYARTPPGPLELAEGIEVLRFLEHGRDVHIVKVPPSLVAVDTPADLERARRILGSRTQVPNVSSTSRST